MAVGEVVRARIDPEVKETAAKVLAAAGLTISDAFRMLLTRIARERVLPGELVIDTAARRRLRDDLGGDDLGGDDLGRDDLGGDDLVLGDLPRDDVLRDDLPRSDAAAPIAAGVRSSVPLAAILDGKPGPVPGPLPGITDDESQAYLRAIGL